MTSKIIQAIKESLNEAVQKIEPIDRPEEKIPISSDCKIWGWIDPTGKVISAVGTKFSTHGDMIAKLADGISKMKAQNKGWIRYAIDARMSMLVELDHKFRENAANALSHFKNNVHVVYIEFIGFGSGNKWTSGTSWKADSVAEAIRFLKYSDKF